MLDSLSPTGWAPAPVHPPDERTIPRLRRWRRRMWLAAALVGAPLAVGAIATLAGVGARGAVDNQRLDIGPRSGLAPAFILPDLAEPARTVAPADFAGRPVVVNFWASWCVPCRREMPRLAEAARRLEGRVAFLGVSYKDRREDALALARETGLPYPSAVDADGDVGSRYGVYGMPTTVFVDAEGRIVGRYLGEMKDGTLDRLLRRLEDTSG